MRSDRKTMSEIPNVGHEVAMAHRPPIYLSTHDHRRLRALVSSKRSWLGEDVRAFLTQELERAVVFAPEQLASNVVTMNSQILFRPDMTEIPECRTLVYDDAAMISPAVCVFTFTGAALVGLVARSRMPYEMGNGKRSILIVEEVTFQPEAHGIRHSHPTRDPRLA